MFVREDWTLFRSLGTLPQKAGVPLSHVRRLVLKELADNALDVCGSVSFGKLDENSYFVEDTGPGIGGGGAAVASLFSVGRPLTSTKILRLPVRGALGNGLRVVVGAVLATGGDLTVRTRGVAYRLKPLDDGTTEVLDEWPQPDAGPGTRVAVRFGDGLPADPGGDELLWARLAEHFKFADTYKGKTSAWWYDSDSFRELLQAAGAMSVPDLIGRFDGYGTAKGETPPGQVRDRLSCVFAGECRAMTPGQAEDLLAALRAGRKAVSVQKIGRVGGGDEYARVAGTLRLRPARGVHPAELPFVVECWASARESQTDDDEIQAYVNGTPITGEMRVRRDKPTAIAVFGCGLKHMVERVSSKKFVVFLNVTSPYVPITTDGKEPDFSRYLDAIGKAVSRATRKLRSAIRKAEQPQSQRDTIVGAIPAARELASGDGAYRYSLRQLYYAVRPTCLEAGFPEVDYKYFAQVITQYEADRGDLPGMYRDPRGTLYHPHLGRDIPLGTLAVEEYERPAWTFNKVLYCEKEGFTHLLKSVRWPERNDCALLSSKGFASRAVRDVIDLLGDSAEAVTFFCVHDADASGTLIYQTLQEATTARAARRVKIINLGLDPWEAVGMDLQVERFTVKGGRKLPVADYVRDHAGEYPPGGVSSWRAWLQGRRVELNAMTSPQFLAWLDRKLAPYRIGKVVPPDAVLRARLDEEAEAAVRARVADQLLRAGGFEDRVAAAMTAVRARPATGDLCALVRDRLAADPGHQWTTPVRDLAAGLLVEPAGGGDDSP